MNLMLIANLHTDLTNSHLQRPLCAFLEITKSQQDVENIQEEQFYFSLRDRIKDF